MSLRIDWLLFDWGKVLVDYRPLGLPKLARMLGTELDALSRFAAETSFFADLTVGALSPDDTITQLARAFGVTLTRAQIGECFRGDVEHELPGIRALITELKSHDRYRLGILSNAFFGHWDSFEGTELYALFDLPMSSHLIRAAKPQPAAYEAALRRMRTEPERVVFIDDKQENVDAARALGIQAFVTDSVATTRQGLCSLLGVTLAAPT